MREDEGAGGVGSGLEPPSLIRRDTFTELNAAEEDALTLASAGLTPSAGAQPPLPPHVQKQRSPTGGTLPGDIHDLKPPLPVELRPAQIVRDGASASIESPPLTVLPSHAA